jgi:hypothetical protein
MKTLHELFKRKPYLAWYVADKEKLSEKSMLEHILNYGNWEDYLTAEKALGLKKISVLFQEMSSQKRVNLRPQTVNYFTKYLRKYA